MTPLAMGHPYLKGSGIVQPFLVGICLRGGGISMGDVTWFEPVTYHILALPPIIFCYNPLFLCRLGDLHPNDKLRCPNPSVAPSGACPGRSSPQGRGRDAAHRPSGHGRPVGRSHVPGPDDVVERGESDRRAAFLLFGASLRLTPSGLTRKLAPGEFLVLFFGRPKKRTRRAGT
jgi:hypothetical protein